MLFVQDEREAIPTRLWRKKANLRSPTEDAPNPTCLPGAYMATRAAYLVLRRVGRSYSK